MVSRIVKKVLSAPGSTQGIFDRIRTASFPAQPDAL
jgi:hypothetical protein